jgi:hypothetical protein
MLYDPQVDAPHSTYPVSTLFCRYVLTELENKYCKKKKKVFAEIDL